MDKSSLYDMGAWTLRIEQIFALVLKTVSTPTSLGPCACEWTGPLAFSSWRSGARLHPLMLFLYHIISLNNNIRFNFVCFYNDLTIFTTTSQCDQHYTLLCIQQRARQQLVQLKNNFTDSMIGLAQDMWAEVTQMCVFFYIKQIQATFSQVNTTEYNPNIFTVL